MPVDATSADSLPQVDADSKTRAGSGRAPSRKRLLEMYRNRIDTAKQWREDQAYDETWKRLIDRYRLKHFPEDDTADDRLAIHVSFSTKNVIGPAVSMNYPSISVNARTAESEEPAVLAEQLVNYWWRHYDFRIPVRRAVDDAIIVGHGWVKVGWRFEEEERDATDEEIQVEFDRRKTELDQQAIESPHLAGRLPTDEEITEELVSFKVTDTKVDAPFVERVSPFDVLVDPEATSELDLKWIAQRIVVPLETAKANEGYDSAARKSLEPNARVAGARWRDRDDGTKVYDDDVQRVELWEYYDIEAGKFCVFASDQETKFLVKPTEMPYTYGHPFVFLPNYDVPEYFYPLGDLEAMEPLQDELNETRTAMMNDRKRYKRRYLARRGELDEDAVEVLETDKDGAVLQIDGDRPFSEVIIPMPAGDIRPEMYDYTQQVLQDIELVTGVSEYQRGGLPETARTATEASIVSEASNARAADKLAKVEKFSAEIAERLIQLAQKFMDQAEVVRVVGRMGEQIWVPIEPDEIEGEFEFEVEAGSTLPKNEGERQQVALQMLQVLGPYVGVYIDGQQLLSHLMREGFGIKNPEKFITAPPPPPPPEGEEGAPQENPAELNMGGGGGETGPGEPPPAPPDAGAGGIELPGDFGSMPPELMMMLQEQASNPDGLVF